MPPSREELEECRIKALSIIRQRPGINQVSLSVAIGVSPRRIHRNGLNQAVSRLIAELEQEGLIWLDRSPLHELPLLYAAGYSPPAKRPLFQPASQHSQTACRSYTVPLNELHKHIAAPVQPIKRPRITATPQPEKEIVTMPAADYPVNPPTDAITSHLQRYGFSTSPIDPEQPEVKVQEMRRRTDSEIKAAIEDALTELLAKGKPFTQQDVKDRASVPGKFLHEHQDVLAKVKQAIEQSRMKAQTDPATLEELEWLRRQNATLKAELAAPRVQTTPQPAELLRLLRLEAEGYKRALQQIEADEQQIAADKKAAVANLAACQRLIESITGEPSTQEFKLVYTTNGNGNGKHASVEA